MKAPTPSCSSTPEAGDLLQVLEQYMHSTGARFTDVFFCIDRRAPPFRLLWDLKFSHKS